MHWELLKKPVVVRYETVCVGLAVHFIAHDVASNIMFARNLNYFVDHYYHWNRRFLYMFGLWPHQSRKEQIVRTCTVTFIQIPLIVHRIYLLFTSGFEIESIFDMLQLLVPAVAILCCYCYICFNYKKVNILYSRMQFDYEQISDEEELAIMKRYASQSKWCMLIMMISTYCYGVFLIGPSILNVILHFFELSDDTRLTLPIPIDNVQNAGAFYYALLFFEAINIYITTTTALVNYGTYILLVQHACSQFNVLVMKIHQPFDKDNFNIRYTWHSGILLDEYSWMIDIIKRYTRTVELIVLTNSLSENIYLLEIFMSLLLIIINFFYLFKLSEIIEVKSEALMRGMFLLGSFVIIYLNFYIGQRLLDHSSKVYLEMCQMPFYKISTKTQKLLLLLMMRSMKPCALSIGGIFICSHEFFSNLMQKAFSYAMMCYTVR